MINAAPKRIPRPPIPPFADDRAHGGDCRTWIRPRGITPRGGGDGDGGLFPLAGGGYGFSQLDVITDCGDAITIARIDAARLMDMAKASGEGDAVTRAEAILQNLIAPRTDFAGLDMNGAMPQLMGVINATPDSFSDGGAYRDPAAAIAAAKRMADDGAAILDIGGESTRPGADAVPLDEEAARILPIITALAAEQNFCISADTRHAKIMEEAIAAGAKIINDVGGLCGDGAAEVVAKNNAAAIVMHMQGTPGTMQNAPRYRYAPCDIFDWLEARLVALADSGIKPGCLAVDPGFGFGKTPEHNLHIMESLALFHGLGVPVLLGASRKSTIAHLSKNEAAGERLPGSLAFAVIAARAGVQMLRVHDVAATRQALACVRPMA